MDAGLRGGHPGAPVVTGFAAIWPISYKSLSHKDLRPAAEGMLQDWGSPWGRAVGASHGSPGASGGPAARVGRKPSQAGH